MGRIPENLLELLLVVRCQAGDDAAFRELVELYSPRLREYARRLIGSPDSVEDVLQDVWTDVYLKVGRLRSPAAFRVWLHRIVHDKAIGELRARGRAEPLNASNEPAWEGNDRDSPDFTSDEINRYVERLPLAHRDVLTLRFTKGMSYEEIAGVIGCPVGTVRSRIHYAKAALRERIERSLT